jgi:hypothetical protein
MRPELLEVYIETSVMLADLKDPSFEEISQSIKTYFNIEVTADEIANFYLPEVQDKLAQMKAWGINY